MPTRRPGPILRRLLHAPAKLCDWHLGRLLGHRFLRRRRRTQMEGVSLAGQSGLAGRVVVCVEWADLGPYGLAVRAGGDAPEAG